ncbi:unnamed protein product [Adineta steineri]|uniref:Dishevelled-like protein n=1 Tax=Adineta steineri TaxID=433720 RepID=A0A815B409_9BILA|nr:unnamed protein product [Adineta steineri]CAF1264000.1 unnamed protein product [Adineta steineri]
MSEDTGKSPVEQPISSSTPNSEIKVFYYIDDQDPPYLTKLNVTGSPCLKDFKNALDRNCSKYKFFFATNDPSIGKVKEEIVNDEQILPFDKQDRILAYLVSIEGSTTSSGGGGGGGSKQSKLPHHFRDDTMLTSTTNSSFNIQQPRLQRMSRRYASANSADYQKYFVKPRAVNDVSSFPSSDLESTTFLDETEDDRYSTVTDSTTISSRYHGRNRPRRRKHRLPSGLDRASSFSSLNSDSTMTLNIITVTLNLDAVNFLGISIVGQSDKTGSSDGGIYVGSIMKGGAVAQDGRIEPGDMILQVNDISFEGLSNDDAVKILRETVQKPGPIKLVVAKCWDPTPRGYFTLPRHEQARPVDPLSWLAHTQAVQNTYNNPQQQILLHHRQSVLNSTTNMSSTISSTNNTMTDNERFGLDLNLTINSDMDTIVRAMAEPDSGLDIRDRIWLKMPIPKSFLGSDLVNWLYENVDGFVNRNDARKYASSMLKAGYIRHTVHKLTFSEQCYYVFGDIYSQGISQLTLDEEPEDYESVSDHTNTTDRRSGDSLLTTTTRQNTVTTFGFVDKNNAPLQSPTQSFLADTHNSGTFGTKSCSTSTSSGSDTRQLVDVPNKLRSSKESFQRAMTNPLPREFFVDVIQCYTKSSQTWICNNSYKSNKTQTANIDYQSVLTNQKVERIFLKNYQLSTFTIDNYPSTLRLFNASNNQFQTIIITPTNRHTSKLRQLILQSNNIRQFSIDTVVLPQSLEIISLANNRLEILDARLFSHLKSLTKLDLRNNQLKRILPQLILSFNILLNNNPLNCECTPEFYRTICQKSTNLKQLTSDSNNCLAPYHESRPYDAHPATYLRFSTFTLICPINAQPAPIIIWSTPFGNLTTINSSNIDLLSSVYDEPIYTTLTALAGPLTARTRHILHAFNTNHLSVTQARAGLRHHISCSGINMLGIYTHEFDFDINSYGQKRALWHLIYTMAFGFFMALVAGALCVTIKRTSYYSADHLRTPPIYPTMTPNSASRTPPNFELNQWLSLAAANISGTLEQVRDKLRLGVQQVSEHMGQTMGRASELFTYGVQHAGGTIRQAAESSAAYLHSIRETSQHRLNTMRDQTLSSLRNPGNLMRAGMNMLTTQVNSLRDYCGVTTGQVMTTNYLLQQQQLHHSQNSPGTVSYLQRNHISTIMEDDESKMESSSLINPLDQTPYAGYIPSNVLTNTSGIGQLDAADNSVLLALSNFNQDYNENVITRGQMSGGIGTFHDHNDELINEPERLIMYGEHRPHC